MLNQRAGVAQGLNEISNLHADIRIENVDISFPGRPALPKKFTLHTPLGQTLALAGVYGAGKKHVDNSASAFLDSGGLDQLAGYGQWPMSVLSLPPLIDYHSLFRD